jgi:hypothetical protein
MKHGVDHALQDPAPVSAPTRRTTKTGVLRAFRSNTLSTRPSTRCQRSFTEATIRMQPRRINHKATAKPHAQLDTCCATKRGGRNRHPPRLPPRPPQNLPLQPAPPGCHEPQMARRSRRSSCRTRGSGGARPVRSAVPGVQGGIGMDSRRRRERSRSTRVRPGGYRKPRHPSAYACAGALLAT